ncbi:MAG: choline dehydrogenase [Thermomicrobiales bacterium]|nr:choline dehydrogenase [Thermomicrobiales bacterium]
MTTSIPRYADTVVLGGGTGGATAAGLLAERTDQSVLLLEAGPDYGPLDGGGWPADLLDARNLPPTHSWGFTSGDRYPGRAIPFERAKVIGGCSAHNGCAAIWGSRLDYDGWAAAGNDGWSAGELLPLFRSVNERLRVRTPALDEVQPFHRAFLEAAPAVGIPLVDDLNDLDGDLGIAPSPVNVHDGIRWNAAFGYLDPVRDKANLTIVGNVVADRLIVENGRVVGAIVVGPDGPRRVDAGRVVLGAGAYGSPGILLRSGIGDPEELREIGIAPVHDLPGVGRNLHDHPAVELVYTGTPELIERLRAFATDHWLPEEQTIAKARSSSCSEGFDIHLYPVGTPYNDPARRRWDFVVPVACMTPRSRGHLRISGADHSLAPLFEHGYVSDTEGADRRVLVDAVNLARAFACQPPLAGLIGQETGPGPEVRTDAEIAGWVDAHVIHYYHPVGTCKMGPASDGEAVVDPRGKVHGLEGVYVADASIIPVAPRANTNIPAAVIGERVARWLSEA